MTVYQIDDITQLYYDAVTGNDGSEMLDPSNTYFAPTSPNWTQRNAASELANKDTSRKFRGYAASKGWSHAAQLFKLVISESPSGIASIVSEFTGRAQTNNGTVPRETRFYVWNFTLSQYDRIGTGDIDSLTDQDWVDTLTSGFSDYVDGSNIIYFMAYTYEGTIVHTGTDGIYANYWMITVTATVSKLGTRPTVHSNFLWRKGS